MPVRLCHLAQGRIEVAAAGALDGTDLVLAGTPPVIAAAVYGGQALEMLETGGALRIEGDRTLAERFVTLFPLPPEAPRPAA